jgi:hypothetical protein
MELIKHELQVPKETKEVIDLLEKIYVQVQDGVQITDLAEIFDELSRAVKGIDQVDDEMKSKHRSDAIAYLALKVGSKF